MSGVYWRAVARVAPREDAQNCQHMTNHFRQGVSHQLRQTDSQDIEVSRLFKKRQNR